MKEKDLDSLKSIAVIVRVIQILHSHKSNGVFDRSEGGRGSLLNKPLIIKQDRMEELL